MQGRGHIQQKGDLYRFSISSNLYSQIVKLKAVEASDFMQDSFDYVKLNGKTYIQEVLKG